MNDARREGGTLLTGDKDPLWYKKAIIYELHVRSFFDANADGIGDFAGLTQKLDYLRDLGITAIWLLPFYPSPLRDDGYDIADYYSINPIYGNLDDFKTFLAEAHARGLRVITELVINHTSEQHPWFQRARRASKGSPERDYYVWSDDPQKYKETRIIFKDFEPSNWTWDSVADSYYWHRFFHHQPDLNFDNPRVHQEIIRILDFWLELGVDGMRLDAIPYLYEREGTSCESLPETHDFLKKLRSHVDTTYGDRVFLAEANQWPEDAVAYFGGGKGDECHMAFHFPLMPRLFMSVRMEDRFPIIDILAQTPPIPETSQWAIFLRNHDELTLEMVTDEERDYMYRMYAAESRARINLGIRRRLAPLLGNDRSKIELLNMLLLSLPGTPVLYYGDELGMGDNTYLGDRNGVRTPMHWSSDKNAGFSRSSPQALVFPVIVEPEYHYESSNVETQERNPNSLLWWHRRVLALRQRSAALTEGTIEFLQPPNRKVLAFIRQSPGETVLVVANLSRFAQAASLDLARFKDSTPVELFGRARFPVIGEQPWLITMAPHAAFWFVLEPKSPELAVNLADLPVIRARGEWTDFLGSRWRSAVEAQLPRFLRQQSWFGGRNRTITSAAFRQWRQVSPELCLCVLNVDYNEADAEDYLAPFAIARGPEAQSIGESFPHLAFARVQDGQGEGLIFDATATPSFWRWLAGTVHKPASAPAGLAFDRQASGLEETESEVDLSNIRLNLQNNSSAAIGPLFLKWLRRVETGVNPELEMSRILTARGHATAPGLIAHGEIQFPDRTRFTAIIALQRIRDSRTGWELTLDALGRFYERVLTQSGPPPALSGDFIQMAQNPAPEEQSGLFGTYFESLRLLGVRLAELHLAFGGDSTDPALAPEPFVPFVQRSLYQSLRNLVLRGIQQLGSQMAGFPPETQELARQAIAAEKSVIDVIKGLNKVALGSVRIRVHGHLHLGQVLHTGRDFVFVDFEGPVFKAYGERRLRRSPLLDAAGILRSLHFASFRAMEAEGAKRSASMESRIELERWSRFWRDSASAAFMRAYMAPLAGSQLLPNTAQGLRVLLDSLLLEQAFTELAVDPVQRASKEHIALQGIMEVLERNNYHGQKV